MRLRLLIERAVLCLLMLRMIAAPLALRPESTAPRPNFHLVARVCAWPAQRPQRIHFNLSLVPLPRGKCPDWIVPQGFWGRLASLPQVVLAWLDRFVENRWSLGQLAGCLRC
jgi:hypothetical protein